jgi:hypothetical protein
MTPEEKARGCRNCVHEGGRDAEKCAKGTVKRHMKNGGQGCWDHVFRDGWELEGGLFEIRDGE